MPLTPDQIYRAKKAKLNRTVKFRESAPQLKHSEIKEAVDAFLKKGGKITKIEVKPFTADVNPYCDAVSDILPEMFLTEKL